MDAIVQTILDFLSAHATQEKAVITSAPAAFSVCVLLVGTLIWLVLRSHYGRVIRIHEERHKQKDETLAVLRSKADSVPSDESQRLIVSEPVTGAPLRTSKVEQPLRIDLFDLGVALGRLKRFDDQYLRDLYSQCEALGLTFSANKLGRVLESWERDLMILEERGGTYEDTETARLFNFQMTDMEDAIRSDLARLPTGETPQQLASIRILSPKDNTLVNWKEPIIGKVYPADRFVQVFVFSAGDRWFPKQARTDGDDWSISDCAIGNEKPGKLVYKLAAVSSVKRYDQPLVRLPEGEAVHIITVRRETR